jgi:hypothetical protein
MLAPMGDILKLIWSAVNWLFRSRASLEAEILTLRHQLTVLRRKSPKRLTFSNLDRLIFTSLYRLAPRVMNALHCHIGPTSEPIWLSDGCPKVLKYRDAG